MRKIKRNKVGKFIDYLIRAFHLPLARVGEVGWSLEVYTARWSPKGVCGKEFIVRHLWQGMNACLMWVCHPRWGDEALLCAFRNWKDIKQRGYLTIGDYIEYPIRGNGCEPSFLVYLVFRTALMPFLHFIFNRTAGVFGFSQGDREFRLMVSNKFNRRGCPPMRVSNFLRRILAEMAYEAL